MTIATKTDHVSSANAQSTLHDAGAVLTKFAQRVLTKAVAIGQFSQGARSAKLFSRLNTLSDAELADRGLNRDDLLAYCFGAKAYL